MDIIQIVPALPPAVNGLGDHALLLARELRDRHKVNTTFIVSNPSAQPIESSGFTVQVLAGRSRNQLFDSITAMSSTHSIVLLHYVGYGYARRGCPFWLVDGLRRWRTGSPQRRLITMFYEISASGPPWRSSFWTAPFQKSIAGRLARISDHCRTNMQIYARRLAQISGRAVSTILAMPVFSNVGEVTGPKPHEQRKRRMVVFGGATWRASVYEKYLTELLAVFQTLDLEELIDIGPPMGLRLELPVPFYQRGMLSAQEVSALLDETRAGILSYGPAFLGKSTIFAAYAAHGVAPILVGSDFDTNEDGLSEGREYISSKRVRNGTNFCAEISIAAHSWYYNHSLAVTAHSYAQVLANISAKT